MGTAGIVDCRNIFEPGEVRRYGLRYEGVGSL
jgi:hypothetical protein